MVPRMYRWPAPKATLTGLETAGTNCLNRNPSPLAFEYGNVLRAEIHDSDQVAFASMPPALPLTPPCPAWTPSGPTGRRSV